MTRSGSLPDVLAVLRRRQEEARAIGLEFVGVVGSVARGEERVDSDADVIVRYLGGTTFSRLFALEQRLAGDLGRPVDLVFSEALGPERRRYIERDLVPL